MIGRPGTCEAVSMQKSDHTTKTKSFTNALISDQNAVSLFLVPFVNMISLTCSSVRPLDYAKISVWTKAKESPTYDPIVINRVFYLRLLDS